MPVYIKGRREGEENYHASNTMSRVKRDVMILVKDERADNERCGQPVDFYA